MDDANDEEEIKKKIHTALDTALQNVGRGSHRNEGEIIAAIYRLDAAFRAKHESWEAAMQSFHRRARVPMKNVNQTLVTEYHQFCLQHKKSPRSEDLEEMELGRRYESKIYNALITCEDDVDIAMHSERILPRHQVDLETLDWNVILRSDEKTFWMGFGGMATANAFSKYAHACYRYRLPGDADAKEKKEIEQMVKDLAPCVYERGVAECPTVESLWLSYIQHLQYMVKDDNTLATKLKSVVERAFRNCPYSVALFRQKLNASLKLADLGLSVLDPDELVKSVQETLEAKFIVSPAGCLQLYLSVVQVIRRRILSILASANEKSYDDTEAVNVKSTDGKDLDDNKQEELQDLCEDIRELYDATDTCIRKQHSAWSEGRASIWSDRTITESMIIAPLVEGNESEGFNPKAAAEIVKCHEKLTKVHQPCHPDTYSSYIKQFISAFPLSSPVMVLSRLRQVRFLYQKALKVVGKPKKPQIVYDTTLQRDYETALRSLCHDYLVFERHFGSDASIASATKNIQKKLSKVFPNGEAVATKEPPAQPTATQQDHAMDVENDDDGPTDQHEVKSASQKRAREDKDSDPPAKKQKSTNDSSDAPAITTNDTEIKEQDSNDDKKQDAQDDDGSKNSRPEVHKVKVGNLEYPAHPFTIRVSKLHPDTQDMDLVDTFRPKCGAIVHARIMRDKHHADHGKGKSKGWGLVQFEERESVEKALELSEVIGLHEKLLKIERSHMPAVLLVPPGMHRVNPKGEGKRSKFNQKRKEQKTKSDNANTKESESPKQEKGAEKQDKASTSNMSVLAFKPRGVQHSQKHRKVKVDIPKKEE